MSQLSRYYGSLLDAYFHSISIVFTFSYSPKHLVQENVIVVTFNYRLSALGFLYLPEAGIYGNAALKDQVIVSIPQWKTHLNNSHPPFSVWYSNGSMIISNTLVAIQKMLHYLDKVLAVSQHTFIHCRRIQSSFNIEYSVTSCCFHWMVLSFTANIFIK